MQQYITSVDHWIAFLLLGWIGGKMIWDALHGGGEEKPAQDALDVKELFVLAVATSIDALAVGITFAFLQVDILPAVALIGCTSPLHRAAAKASMLSPTPIRKSSANPI